MKRLLAIATIFFGFTALPAAWALPVNGTGMLTSNVVMGNGIENGDFAGASFNAYEVALRGKERYTDNYGYDNDSTYTFAQGTDINLDWSVNSNTCVSAPTILCAFRPVSTAEWQLTLPGFGSIDPVNGTLATLTPADNSFGNNATPQSGGLEAGGDVPTYETLRTTYNVAQNSINLGVLAAGTYSFTLEKHTPIVCVTLPCPQYNPSVSIDIVVTSVPEPGTLSSIATGLLLLGMARRRRQQ